MPPSGVPDQRPYQETVLSSRTDNFGIELLPSGFLLEDRQDWSKDYGWNPIEVSVKKVPTGTITP